MLLWKKKKTLHGSFKCVCVFVLSSHRCIKVITLVYFVLEWEAVHTESDLDCRVIITPILLMIITASLSSQNPASSISRKVYSTDAQIGVHGLKV